MGADQRIDRSVAFWRRRVRAFGAGLDFGEQVMVIEQHIGEMYCPLLAAMQEVFAGLGEVSAVYFGSAPGLDWPARKVVLEEGAPFVMWPGPVEPGCAQGDALQREAGEMCFGLGFDLSG